MKEWNSLGHRITKLRKCLGMNQTELGKRLDASAMTVSRWERGAQLPSGTALIKLGTLAHEDVEACWTFWELAGLTTESVVKVLPESPKKWHRTIPVLQIVKAGAADKLGADSLVAIPLLKLVASAGKARGSSNHDLRYARSQQAIVAPRIWCPNPNDTVCLMVRGESMEPVLHDGYIIVVDQKQNDKKELNGMIIVARHDKFGLVVTRYWRLNGSEALVSDNRTHEPVPWTSGWRIVGKVLWWIGLPTGANS